MQENNTRVFCLYSPIFAIKSFICVRMRHCCAPKKESMALLIILGDDLGSGRGKQPGFSPNKNDLRELAG
jgi:hypothetical protein